MLDRFARRYKQHLSQPFIAALVTLIASLPYCATIKAEESIVSHGVLLQGNGRLAQLSPSGDVQWEMPWGGIHDLHVLPSGNLLTRKGPATVVEINPQSKKVVWSYASATAGGNKRWQQEIRSKTKQPPKRPLIEVHAFVPIRYRNDGTPVAISQDDAHWKGDLMIAESGRGRLIEINRQGEIRHQIPLVIDHPNPHTDTRLVRLTNQGTYLVCHEADGKLREYDREGNVVWEYAVPLFDKSPQGGHGPEAFGNKAFCALRLPSGETLVATGNGHSVLRVDPQGEITWQIHQRDLPELLSHG